MTKQALSRNNYGQKCELPILKIESKLWIRHPENSEDSDDSNNSFPVDAYRDWSRLGWSHIVTGRGIVTESNPNYQDFIFLLVFPELLCVSLI